MSMGALVDDHTGKGRCTIQNLLSPIPFLTDIPPKRESQMSPIVTPKKIFIGAAIKMKETTHLPELIFLVV